MGIYTFDSITKEQWIDFFKNSELCHNKLKEIIRTMYCNGYAMYASELSKELGYQHYVVINKILLIQS